jgi:hypothetical protein
LSGAAEVCRLYATFLEEAQENFNLAGLGKFPGASAEATYRLLAKGAMTKAQQEERCQRAMLEVISEFEKRGITKIEKDTLFAAAQIVAQMETDQALLNLVYAGEVRLGFDSNGEIEISDKQ